MTRLTDRVEERLAALNLNPFSAAREAGLKDDYVRDILRGKVKEPSSVKLIQLARALQCDPKYLLGIHDRPGEAPPPVPEFGLTENVSLLVRYSLQAGIFVAVDDRTPEPGLRFTVLQSYLNQDHGQWLVRVRDDSCDKVAPPGYYLQVADVQDMAGYKPTHDDFLIVEQVEQTRAGGLLVERTLRQVDDFHWVKDEIRLTLPSHNLRWKDNAVIIPGEASWSPQQEGPVRIVGKVTNAYGGFGGGPFAK